MKLPSSATSAILGSESIIVQTCRRSPGSRCTLRSGRSARTLRIAETLLFPGSPSASRMIGTQPAMTTVMSSIFQASRA